MSRPLGTSLRLHLLAWCFIQVAKCQTEYTTELSGSGSGAVTELYGVVAPSSGSDGEVTEDTANALFTGTGTGSDASNSAGVTGTGTATGTGTGVSATGGGGNATSAQQGSSESREREALEHEGSEQSSVVFLPDTEGYVPIQQLRPAPARPAKKTSASTSGSGASAPASVPVVAAAAAGSAPAPAPGTSRLPSGAGLVPVPGAGTGAGAGLLQTAASDSPEYRAPLETWDRDYRRLRSNTTRVQHIEAECQDDYMKIRIGFNGSFGGLLYSSGYAYDPECVYINGTGRDYYEFYIQLNRCGTLGKNSLGEDSRKNPTKNFMWNTVTVQYNPMIEEEWDEHFKVTCEYGYDFWKTVTFPFLDVEVATGNPVVFTLSPPECYMEIRYGYGTGGTRVTGPVRVGDPLTLIIYMRSKYDGFDIVVNDCWAHNGGNKRIQLIDQYGCPVDDKLISRFRGTWSEQGAFETQVFAYMKTFRFTGSPALYIECDVRMCHGRCPSQPCHWRNAKSVSKRSVGSPASLPLLMGASSASSAGFTSSPSPSTVSTLSENVNLFQSLRVLQEGENIDSVSTANSTLQEQANSVCLKPGAFQTLLGLGCSLLCLLTSTVLVLCCRVRRLAGEAKPQDLPLPLPAAALALSAPRFDHTTFMTHKGRLN